MLAGTADADAQRLGFSQHFFAVDHLRALSGLALERRDLDAAEHLTERVLSITEQRRPLFEFLALLDRAQIWAARGQVRDALTTVGAARQVLTSAPARRCSPGPTSRRRCCASRLAIRAPPRSWPAICPPRAAGCCWPGLRSRPVMTMASSSTCGQRPWAT